MTDTSAVPVVPASPVVTPIIVTPPVVAPPAPVPTLTPTPAVSCTYVVVDALDYQVDGEEIHVIAGSLVSDLPDAAIPSLLIARHIAHVPSLAPPDPVPDPVPDPDDAPDPVLDAVIETEEGAV